MNPSQLYTKQNHQNQVQPCSISKFNQNPSAVHTIFRANKWRQQRSIVDTIPHLTLATPLVAQPNFSSTGFVHLKGITDYPPHSHTLGDIFRKPFKIQTPSVHLHQLCAHHPPRFTMPGMPVCRAKRWRRWCDDTRSTKWGGRTRIGRLHFMCSCSHNESIWFICEREGGGKGATTELHWQFHIIQPALPWL